MTALRRTGARYHIPFYRALLADAYQRVNRTLVDRLHLLDKAIYRAERTREHDFEAELHRLKGELLVIGVGNQIEPEECFQRAIALARGQNAKLWELRAATSLARLWKNQNKTALARDLLAPVYGWFDEGFDTPDLKNAKALLDELHTQ